MFTQTNMKKLFLAIILIIVAGLPLTVSAHGIGEVYALPVPLRYYLLGAGFVIAVSFFLIAAFLGKEKKEGEMTEKIIAVPWLPRLLKVLKAIGLFLLFLTIATGIFGVQLSQVNFAPVFFWVYFLIGMGILSLFIGNIWDKLNPWKILSNRIKANVKTSNISGGVGILLLFMLFWWELISGHSFVPNFVGLILFLYTILNLGLSQYYKNWFKVSEVFSVLYGFIGHLAYFHISDDNKSIIRSSKRETLTGEAVPWWIIGIASVLLAGASFDSLKESTMWEEFVRSIGMSPYTQLPATLGLLLSGLFYFGTYSLAIWIMKKLTKAKESFHTHSRQFVLSLVPIAFGYVLAHNFSLVVVMSRRMFGMISDPFGFAWNLFGTANYVQGELLLGAKAVWFIEIGLIVLAHIIGVMYAHILAKAIFKSNKLALKSQLPMIILMVGYTIIALWLLSLPLVVRPA